LLHEAAADGSSEAFTHFRAAAAFRCRQRGAFREPISPPCCRYAAAMIDYAAVSLP